MAKAILGGEEYTIPELNFMALERAWPFVEIAMVSSGADPMEGPLAALRIIAAGIMEAEEFDPARYKVTAGMDEPDKVHDQIVFFLRKKMKAREIQNLKTVIDEIIDEAGLSAGSDTVGNEKATEKSLQETAPASLQSSLPLDVKAEAGSA